MTARWQPLDCFVPVASRSRLRLSFTTWLPSSLTRALDAASIRPGGDGIKAGYMFTIHPERNWVPHHECRGIRFQIGAITMSYRIFLAGATGAIGSRMVPILRDAGHILVGTTRSTAKAETLRSLGVEPVLVDVFDAELLSRAMEAARPDVVIHQLTDLPKKL